MPYELLATARTPALIIYLLDVSASMTQQLGTKRRIDVVMDALQVALRQMVFRSTKGARVSPRYKVAMYAYSDHVYDLLDGVKTVDQIAKMGFPELSTQRTTDSARAFAQVEKLLQQELPGLDGCPAPLVCHMTDGEYTGDDPEPYARRIMGMEVPDGNVLVENIFISDVIIEQPINNVREWPGILRRTNLKNEYAKKLRNMSSPLPRSYHAMMLESGYRMDDKAVMMLPGISPSLVEMGFVMSAATPVSR
ncbi:MAG: VWA domain-containing protein [Chloroflexi bacterium]|nr:VWA domain-containing protein [Chloroflexota bacterium]